MGVEGAELHFRKMERVLWKEGGDGCTMWTQVTHEQCRFQLRGSTYTWIFSHKYTVDSPYSWVSHPQIQPNVDWNFSLWLVESVAVELRKQRANCTIPSYLRDLSIHGFWYLQGLLGPIPHGYQGTECLWTVLFKSDSWDGQFYVYFTTILKTEEIACLKQK